MIIALVARHGADTHGLDPLARLQVSIDAQRAAHIALHALAHDRRRALAAHRRRRINLVRVVPRPWTHLLAEAAATRSTRRPRPPPVARLRGPAHRPDRPRAHDRRDPASSSRSSPAQPTDPGRPGDHGHPQRGLPPPRARAPVTSTPDQRAGTCATSHQAECAGSHGQRGIRPPEALHPDPGGQDIRTIWAAQVTEPGLMATP